MTSSAIDRVEAWLASLVPRIESDERATLRRLAEEWRFVAHTLGVHGGAACGALLALVRKAFGDPHADLVWGGSMWVCSVMHDGDVRRFADRTEPLALLAALEASPR